MRLSYRVVLAAVVLGTMFILGRCGRRTSANGPRLAVPTVLPKDDNEQIVIDPRSHVITIKRQDGTTVTHLPDRQTVIDIRKDGKVVVTAPQYGLEARLFVGLGYSDTVRIALGIDGLNWKALDLGGGVQVDAHMSDPRVFLGLSYTVKDNLRLTLSLDHHKVPGAFLSVRF